MSATKVTKTVPGDVVRAVIRSAPAISMGLGW